MKINSMKPRLDNLSSDLKINIRIRFYGWDSAAMLLDPACAAFFLLLNEINVAMQERTSDEVPMPTYFRFLALLAFKIFAAEQVIFELYYMMHCTHLGDYILIFTLLDPGGCSYFRSWFRWKI